MIQYLITAIIDIAVGILAFSKKGNPASKALSFTVFSLGIWSLELFFLTIIKDENILTVLFHITRWGMFFIPSTFALLTWRLVGSRSKNFKTFFLIPGFVMSGLLSLTNTFLFPSALKVVDGGFLPKVDIIYYLFFVSFIWCFVGAIGLVVSSYKTSSVRGKQRLKWLLITLFVTFICGVLVIVSISSNFYLSKYFGAITNITFVALLFYSTIQHNLMDIRLALSVGLSRVILLGFFVWSYFVFISEIGDQAQSTGGILVLLAFVVLILEAYPRLLRWILPNAKKMLVKHGYEFDQVKGDTEKALRSVMNFSDMFDVLNHLFLKILKVTNYKILIVKSDSLNDPSARSEFPSHIPLEFISKNNSIVSYCIDQKGLVMADEMPDPSRTEMEQMNATLCFSVVIGNDVPAIVLVGGSSTLSYFRYDDIRIFEWLAHELGQVLQRLIRLEQMQDQLGEAKKTLSMLGMMSHYHHDIKAPFAIIDGVLSNDIYDRDKQKNIVLEQVERGSRLIATMASILGGKRRRRVQACALDALIKDCLFVFETSIDNVEFISGEVPKVAGDAEDLKILFINLIKNATEARRGQEDLTLVVKSWMKDMRICFSIQDNGVGMSEQQLATLWEQDYSTKEFGHGIGMQAIKRIADEHGAQIEVRSEVGNGTEFIVSFPAMLIMDEEKPTDVADELNLRRAANTK